ncbi:hypothetical protein LI951_05895 [Enterococcus sp. BWT-B8]|uniref:hypothetical protein n=1 Tax=Enterococcus sp. BWT-B8 TaxID=2885157 RepID=UPI001E5BD1AF|nr:hypothetical protein [Enterococcus sp. BWT-B8]MCB5951591.1 hypothetical protein [Enterococcus sp. BWT-B8]
MDCSRRAGKLDTVFYVSSKEVVQTIYKTALKAGGKDNGEPEYRYQYSENYYAAFVHDVIQHGLIIHSKDMLLFCYYI